jgi:hypothetical protein
MFIDSVLYNDLLTGWRKNHSFVKDFIQKNDIYIVYVHSEDSVDLFESLESKDKDKKELARELIFKSVIQDCIGKNLKGLCPSLPDERLVQLILNEHLLYDSIDLSEKEEKRILYTSRLNNRNTVLLAIALAKRVLLESFSFDQLVELLKNRRSLLSVFARYMLMRIPKRQLDLQTMIALFEEYHKNLSMAMSEFNDTNTTTLPPNFHALHRDFEYAFEDIFRKYFWDDIPKNIKEKISQ